MELFGNLLLAAYLGALACLAAFGVHRLALLRLSRRVGPPTPPLPTGSPPGPRSGPEPMVTVQLPVYNERYVVGRLIQTIARIAALIGSERVGHAWAIAVRSGSTASLSTELSGL